MADEKVCLFIKPYCPWCHQAIDWLNKKGIKYEILDVIAEPSFFKEMIDISGQTYAPVIQVEDKVLADFDTKQLEKFWKENNFDQVLK
ncbi:MAG: glutaredoxin family protein [Limisphaerales bacterium]